MSVKIFKIIVCLFFLLKLICVVKSQASCSPGSQDNGSGSCVTCPVGKYKDATGSFSCYNCPADRNSTYGYSSSSADSIDDCFPFPDGYKWENYPYTCPIYGEVYDAVNNICELCSNDANNPLFLVPYQVDRQTNYDGFYDVNGNYVNIYYYSNSADKKPKSIYCVPSCPNGITQITYNSIDICRCPQYSYPSVDVQTGEHFCKCDSNAYNSSGTCKWCDAGSIVVNGVCQECPINTYASSGDVACTACSGSQPYAPKGSGSCLYCPAGEKYTTLDPILQLYNCEECNVGQYSSGYWCNSCNSGSYSTKASNICTPCPAGKSSSSYGSITSDDCVDCQPGYFSELMKYSGSYRTCSKCYAGNYSASYGSLSCTICPSNRPYTTLNSNFQAPSIDYCYSLPNGYQNISNNLFKACSVYGQVYNGSSCIKCSDTVNALFFGYDKNAFSSVNGNFYYSSSDQPKSVYCVPSCPSGSITGNSNNIDICKCPQYSHPSKDVQTGEYFCECDSNAYNSSGTCKLCDAGSILVNGVCQECPVNTYAYSGDVACTACGSGGYSSQLYAPKGSGSCYTCPGGKSQNYVNGQWLCNECSAGQYSSGSYCSNCYLGSYSTKANYTCTPCPAGKSSSSYGSTSGNNCVDCQAGSYSELKKDSGSYRTCSGCVPGKYSTSSGSSSCTNCPSNRPYTTLNSNRYATSIDYCYSLPNGYQAISNNLFKACSVYGQVYNGSSCIKCSDTVNSLFFGYDKNYFSSVGGNYYYSSPDQPKPVYCVPSCPNGSTNSTSNDIDVCRCPEKSYPSRDVQTGEYFCKCDSNAYNSSGTCELCDTGSIIVNGVCQECPENTKSSSGALSCTACSVGQPYAPQGSESCYTCPGGSYLNNNNNEQSQCKECNAGQYSYMGYTCYGCTPGSYSTVANFTCTPCPAGKGGYSPGGNYGSGAISADSCSDCRAGYFSELRKDYGRYSLCSSCTVGKYSTSSGSSSCFNCPPDRPYTYPGELYANQYPYYSNSGTSYRPDSINSCFSLPTGYFLEDGLPKACLFGQTYINGKCTNCPSGEFFSPGFTPLTTSLSGINLRIYLENSLVVGTSCNTICPIGSVPGFSNGISICVKCQTEEHKYYDKSTLKCKICSEDSYPEYDGTISCKTCPYPWISYIDKRDSTRCAPWQTGLCLCLPTGAIVSIVVIIAVAFIASLAIFFISSQPKFLVPVEITSRKEYWMHKLKEYESVTCLVLFYIGLPFIDWLTDLSFLLSNKFYNFVLFFAMLFLFSINAFLFIHVLFQKKAVPKFYILSFPEKFVEKEYDSLLKIFVTFILLVPYVIVNSPFLVVWLTIGIMFYTTKTFTIIPIQKLWMDIWTGRRFKQKVFMEVEMQGKSYIDNEEEDLNTSSTKAKIGNIEIDATVLNESIYYHLIIETFPLLIIQVFNNTFYNAWTPLGIFSVSFSVFNAINGLYRIAYYVWWKKYTLSCIPVELEFFPKAQVDAGQQYLFSTEYKRLEPLFKLYEEKFNQYDEKHNGHDEKNYVQDEKLELVFSIFSKHKLYELNSKEDTMPLIEEDL